MEGDDVVMEEEEEERVGKKGGPVAGAILRMRLENFMCHSLMEVELGSHVNFITGQNGSGKSAVLTALQTVFGASARGTDRGVSVKDFIKTGQSYFKITATMFNEGPDAYQPEVFGDRILVERECTDRGSSHFKLKDASGRIVGKKKEDVTHLVDYFNIEVDNPCVIMGQDKAKSFLHSGSPADRFKFYFRATMLEPVTNIVNELKAGVDKIEDLVRDKQEEIKPLQQEVADFEAQVQEAEEFKRWEREADNLKKQLAWAYVYTEEQVSEELEVEAEQWRSVRIPKTQDKIAEHQAEVERLEQAVIAKQEESTRDRDTSKQAEESANIAKEAVRQASAARGEVDARLRAKRRELEQNRNRHKELKAMADQTRQDTQQADEAESSEREAAVQEKQARIGEQKAAIDRLGAEEQQLAEARQRKQDEARAVSAEVEEHKRAQNDSQGYLRRLRGQQTNTETRFGEGVPRLKEAISRRQGQFSCQPIGPIGTYLTLADPKWSKAVEEAAGQMFQNWVVHNHEDLRLFKQCCQDANANTTAVVYSFDHAPYNPAPHQLPRPELLTVRKVLQSTNHTILNVLMDQSSIETQVLIEDPGEARQVAFSREQNIKEVYDRDGSKSFVRGQSESTLPPNHHRQARLGVDLRQQIGQAEATLADVARRLQEASERKGGFDEELRHLDREISRVKGQKVSAERCLRGLEYESRELERARRADARPEADVGELEDEMQELDKEAEEMRGQLTELEEQLQRTQEEFAEGMERQKEAVKQLKNEAGAAERFARELFELERARDKAINDVRHYESIKSKLEKELADKEEQRVTQQGKCEETCAKAAAFCDEEIVKAMECDSWDVDKLCRKIHNLEAKVQKEDQRRGYSLGELNRKLDKARKRLAKEAGTCQLVADICESLRARVQKRRKALSKAAKELKCQITWMFNNNLHKRGWTGKVHVNYDTGTLDLEVDAPDGSKAKIKDTRSLSGGERSFSTLAFALALHDLVESPFRAMDEFDVFMDDVTRKICLQTAVNFAVGQGSQWIFITPHDISDVKESDKVKKQIMRPPRP